MKQCKKCGETKDHSNFAPRRDLKDGLATWCKQCYARMAKENYSPEAKQVRDRLKHGVSQEKYMEKLLEQNSGCAICGRTDARLMIDHDHGCCSGTYGCSKCFRGLLCHGCNTGIGLLKDSPVILSSAIKYLTK